MERICLDFEAALDFLRGEPAIIDKMRYYADHEEICITSLTMMHLLEVINKPEVVFMFSANVTVLPFDKKAAQIASKIMNDFKERGDTPKISDAVLTAATCMANEAFVFTRTTGKFDGIKGLKKV
jgi:predicted nucleic acid-binding protein